MHKTLLLKGNEKEIVWNQEHNRTEQGIIEDQSLTTHGVQSDQAPNVVVKVHVALFITVPADHQLEELVVEREACTRTEQERDTNETKHIYAGTSWLSSVHQSWLFVVTVTRALWWQRNMHFHVSVLMISELTCSFEGSGKLLWGDEPWAVCVIWYVDALNQNGNKVTQEVKVHSTFY